MVRVIIDGSRCKECEYCLHFCPRGNVLKKGEAVNRKGYRFVVVSQPDECIGCGVCATVCPEMAISIQDGS